MLCILITILCCLPLPAQSAAFTLDRAEALALSRNPDIKMAEQDVVMARADLGAARAALLIPGIQLTGSFGYADPAGSSFPYNDSWSAGLAVRKDLFSGGRFWFAMETKRLAVDYAEVKLTEKKKEILLAVRTGYYNLVLLKEKLRIAVEYDAGLKYRLESARINYANGVSSQLDYLKEQVRYKNYQPLLLKARNDYRMARLNYGAFIGFPATSPSTGSGQGSPKGGELHPELAEGFAEVPEPVGDILDSMKTQVPTTDETAIISAALTKDLTLRSLDFETSVNEANKAALWSARWPLLSGSFNYKFDYKSSGGGDRSFTPGWSAGVSLVIPLDPWLPGVSQVSQQLEGAQALAEKNRHRRRQTEAAVIARVKGLLAGLALAEESIAGQKENVKQAKLVQEIAQRQYREGGLSSLDLSDAELGYSQALANYWQALYDRYADVLQLIDYIE